MKYLVFCFVLLCTAAKSQVVIEEDVARYFLKRNSIVEILEKRDSLYVSVMNYYNAELFQKDKLLANCDKENANLRESVYLFQKESRDLMNQNKEITKLLAKEQRKVRLCLIGMIIVALL